MVIYHFGGIGNRRELGHRNDKGISRLKSRLEFLMTNSIIWKVTLYNNGLWDADDGIIFLGQSQSKGKKEKKGFYV